MTMYINTKLYGVAKEKGNDINVRIDDDAEAARARALDYAKRHDCRVYNYMNGSNTWYTEDGKEISDGHKGTD